LAGKGNSPGKTGVALGQRKVLNSLKLEIGKQVTNMKPYGIGLIILLISFVVATYTVYVSYNYLANPPQSAGEATARIDELKTATLLGLIAQIIGIVGILVFLVEFVKHEHVISSTKGTSPPP
jgi:beta-lactamase regulating signal transducer with metallopeptidase domain